MLPDLLDEDGARDLLGNRGPKLRKCIDAAWERWLKNPDAPTASKLTRAVTVYDYLTANVQTAFADDDGVSFTRKHGSLHMTTDKTAVIKFKKFRDRRLRTSGIATTARNNFLEQTGSLSGMVVTNLVVGYLLDELEQGLERIAVTCPLGSGNLWALDLGVSAGEDSGTTAATPIDSVDPGDAGTTIRSTKTSAKHDNAVNEE